MMLVKADRIIARNMKFWEDNLFSAENILFSQSRSAPRYSDPFDPYTNIHNENKRITSLLYRFRKLYGAYIGTLIA